VRTPTGAPETEGVESGLGADMEMSAGERKGVSGPSRMTTRWWATAARMAARCAAMGSAARSPASPSRWADGARPGAG